MATFWDEHYRHYVNGCDLCDGVDGGAVGDAPEETKPATTEDR
jgi:hypothetical protein